MIHLVPGECYEMLHQTMTPPSLSNPQYTVAKENMKLQPANLKKSRIECFNKKSKVILWSRSRIRKTNLALKVSNYHRSSKKEPCPLYDMQNKQECKTYRRIQVIGGRLHQCCVICFIPWLQISRFSTTFFSFKIPNFPKLLK